MQIRGLDLVASGCGLGTDFSFRCRAHGTWWCGGTAHYADILTTFAFVVPASIFAGDVETSAYGLDRVVRVGNAGDGGDGCAAGIRAVEVDVHC